MGESKPFSEKPMKIDDVQSLKADTPLRNSHLDNIPQADLDLINLGVGFSREGDNDCVNSIASLLFENHYK